MMAPQFSTFMDIHGTAVPKTIVCCTSLSHIDRKFNQASHAQGGHSTTPSTCDSGRKTSCCTTSPSAECCTCSRRAEWHGIKACGSCLHCPFLPGCDKRNTKTHLMNAPRQASCLRSYNARGDGGGWWLGGRSGVCCKWQCLSRSASLNQHRNGQIQASSSDQKHKLYTCC
jgi:hypothetical protein